eukprot:7545431-Alexandrium_andersonii.AAC.1
MSKIYHGIGRSRVVDRYHMFAPGMQCGGIPKRGTDFAGHAVRMFLLMAAARRLSCAVLFVDVISAFYAVLRPLVLATSS